MRKALPLTMALIVAAGISGCASTGETTPSVDYDAEIAALKKKGDEAASLVEQERELSRALRSEVAAKDVEIRRLAQKLSVRLLDRVLFASGSADILPEGQGLLDKVAGVIKGEAQTVRIEGHTDDVAIGSKLKAAFPSNWELSAARAATVARYFQYRHGIEPTRMLVVGFAGYRPLVPNDSAENRQRNRRVEIQLIPRD